MKTMMAVAALALATASVGAKPQPNANPQPKTGTVIVYRKWHLVGWGNRMSLSVDGRPVAQLKNGYYYKLELPEGNHVLSHPRFLYDGDPQTIHVTAGQTIYFCEWMVSFVGDIFEVAEDQNEARQSVSHMPQQTTPK